nr:hypothetical protein [uncultured Flavobacterium sp.]
MRIILYTTIITILSSIQVKAQNPIQDKIFYGANTHKYKDEIKGKLGEINYIVYQFSDSVVTSYTYQKFLYQNQTDQIQNVVLPNGKIKQKNETYTLSNHKINFSNKKYQYFIYQNDTINAYINTDFETQNIADQFVEITKEDLSKILSANKF